MMTVSKENEYIAKCFVYSIEDYYITSATPSLKDGNFEFGGQCEETLEEVTIEICAGRVFEYMNHLLLLAGQEEVSEEDYFKDIQNEHYLVELAQRAGQHLLELADFDQSYHIQIKTKNETIHSFLQSQQS